MSSKAKTFIQLHDTKLKEVHINNIYWKWVIKLKIKHKKPNITKNFDLNNFKIDEKPYKSITICYITYLTIKEYIKIYCV